MTGYDSAPRTERLDYRNRVRFCPIERVLYVGEITVKDVILAAADYSMLFQALSAGLKTTLVDRPG